VLIDWIGWRGLLEPLGGCDRRIRHPDLHRGAGAGSGFAEGVGPAQLKIRLCEFKFWRLAPLSATCVGSARALQGLSAATWLTDVEGLNRPNVMTQLFVMFFRFSLAFRQQVHLVPKMMGFRAT